MPVYEYACEKCGHEFEVEQRMSDAPVKVCPVCRARKVKRLISRTSFVLKGSGWYSDLYSSPTKSEAKSEKSDASEKPAVSAEKSDSSEAGTAKSESPKSGSKPKDPGKAKGKSKAA